MLGIILTVSCFQLWYTFAGLGILFAPNPAVEAESISLAPQEATPKQEAVRGSDAIDAHNLYPLKISMPTVNIELPIISVPLYNGSWEVFDGVANYAEQTSLIDVDGGNIGIYGHDRANAFTNVKNLKVGDLITIQTKENIDAIYEVVDSYQTDPSSVTEFYPTETPTVTIITCDGPISELRYVVKAKLIEVKQHASEQ